MRPIERLILLDRMLYVMEQSAAAVSGGLNNGPSAVSGGFKSGVPAPPAARAADEASREETGALDGKAGAGAGAARSTTTIVPLFDPVVSPRNTAIVAFATAPR